MTDLTPRELEILSLIAEGKTTAEIAEQLFIEPVTAASHCTNAYAKLGVHSRLAAATYVWQQRIAQAQAETECLRQQIAAAQPEFAALAFYLKRAVDLMEKLGDL